jgi:hypothetical protein
MNGVLSVHGHQKCLKSEGINMMHEFFMALCLLCVAKESRPTISNAAIIARAQEGPL